LGRLETEHDNLRAALSWALERNEAELAVQLGGALWRFWTRVGHWSEGRRWLGEGLTQASTVPASVRAIALNGLGILLESQGDNRQAQTLFEESLELCRKIGDGKGIAMALCQLGWVAMPQGDYV